MYNYPFIDFNALNQTMNKAQLDPMRKLSFMYQELGGEFYDSEKTLFKSGAKFALSAIGGLAIELGPRQELMLLGKPTHITEIRNSFIKTVGSATFMNSFNPGNKSFDDIAVEALNKGDTSGFDTLNISVLLVGITSRAEQELTLKSPTLHIARLIPSADMSHNMLINNEAHYALYRAVQTATQTAIKTYNVEVSVEDQNLLFSSAKANAILLTGSVKNFMTLADLQDKTGNSEELTSILKKLELLIKTVFGN